ncbi:carboxypeptidase regulatory-like domain-containing protein [Actinoplanes sp. NBC_00393]|uniref:carboxypeptidase regulatory-like domain-containing protein n=1 Tax=Actinoplanes sp. NBC_00393 TaxID=2975953 RepID=UPI002E23804D
MILTSGRRALTSAATTLALVLAGLSLSAGPAQASPARHALPQATITFPAGSEATSGSTLAVTFEAGGDRRVTAFRYGWANPELDRSVDAGTHGGPATISLDVGTITGQRPLYVAAVDRRGKVGPLNQATITVTPSPRLDGWVFSPRWLPVEGLTVTLEPGGLRTTTDADGYYEFTGFPPGLYTVSATLDGECPSTASQTLPLDQQGLTFELYLVRIDDTCVPEEDMPPAGL